MDDVAEVFRRAHEDLPREAPGSEGTTRLLLRLADPLPPRPVVVDVGCGTGPATVVLAAATGGHVTAVDVHEPYLATVARRARAAGVEDRVEVVAASMDALPLAPGSVDLLWAEGSAYVVGVEAALSAWRPLLAPGGVVVLTDAVWTTPHPSPGARAFWDAGYPAMRTTGRLVVALEEAGWDVGAALLLPDADWAAYYGPLAERLAALRREGVAEDTLAVVGEELGVRAAHGHEYGYVGLVLRPRG